MRRKKEHCGGGYGLKQGVGLWIELGWLCSRPHSLPTIQDCVRVSVCEQQGSVVRPINRRSGNRQGEPGCV